MKKKLIKCARRTAMVALYVIAIVGYVVCMLLGTLEYGLVRKTCREPKLPQYYLRAMEWVKKKIEGKEVGM